MISVTESVYATIKEKIVTCELPPGAIIDQSALIEELGVSKTPIREAINALEMEGLLIVVPRRAVIVSSISINEIGHIYTVRETLEPLIARMATVEAEMEKLESYADIFRREEPDYRLITRTDFEMHCYFAQKSGNPYFARLMENVLSQNRRIVALGARIPDRLRGSNAEHLEVIERMMARDAEGAEAAMRRHIASARNVASIINTLVQ